MTDKRTTTHNQVWIKNDLCEQAMNAEIPNTEDVPQQLNTPKPPPAQRSPESRPGRGLTNPNPQNRRMT